MARNQLHYNSVPIVIDGLWHRKTSLVQDLKLNKSTIVRYLHVSIFLYRCKSREI
jgi:hypothetical protein